MSTASANAAISAQDEGRSERKLRLRGLFAIAVLLPLTFAEQSYDNVMELLHGEELFPREVTWGDTADFGGSEWRLANLRGGKGVEGVPDDAYAVLADFTVKIDDPDLPKRWSICKLMLVDADGRRWFPTTIRGLPPMGDARTCGSAIFSGAKKGDTLKISETFIVPDDAIKTVRPAIGLASEQPYFLLFERPPA